MELKKINLDFSVCKVETLADVDMSQEFCFIGKTDEELSVVCPTVVVPEKTIFRKLYQQWGLQNHVMFYNNL